MLSKAEYTANANMLNSLYTLSLSNDLEPDNREQFSVELYTYFIPADTLGVV
jgi:hypothetical protein